MATFIIIGFFVAILSVLNHYEKEYQKESQNSDI
jgi:hypothetical protein